MYGLFTNIYPLNYQPAVEMLGFLSNFCWVDSGLDPQQVAPKMSWSLELTSMTHWKCLTTFDKDLHKFCQVMMF